MFLKCKLFWAIIIASALNIEMSSNKERTIRKWYNKIARKLEVFSRIYFNKVALEVET